MTAPPLFIVGCGRSGTTMLRLMLDSHPELAIPGESHFLPSLAARFKAAGPDAAADPRAVAAAVMRTDHWKRWDASAELVQRRVGQVGAPTFAGAVEAVFMAYAEGHGKSRWGDKTPIYVLSIPLLAGIFPRARFVHVIRDGRDVASSYLSVPWGPRTIWQAARKWNRDVSAGRRAGAALGQDRYLEVRYEDLTADPHATLDRVCSFVELPFHERMLDFHTTAAGRVQARPGFGGYHSSVTRPPTRGLRDWRTQMRPEDVMAFEAVAGPLLAELRFERRFTEIPVGLRLRRSAILAGLALYGAGSRAKKAVLRRMAGLETETAGAPEPEHAR